MTSNPVRAPLMTARHPGAAALAETLARARPASDGGAYVELCDPKESLRSTSWNGPLAGWTFAVKDIIAVRDKPMRAGSEVRERVPVEAADAPIVAALRNAGAALVGTTALHELALGVTGVNRHAGTPLNPVDPERIPGGSSSGSAVAVAEGSARFALGTDTGGSVRIPAALCGVVGFKPARGRWGLDGVLPLAPTLDHLGLLATTVGDVIRVYEAVEARALRRFPPPSTIGVPFDQLAAADAEVAAAMESALELLATSGVQIVPVAWPSSEEVRNCSTVLLLAEAASTHGGLLRERPDSLGCDVRERLSIGRDLPRAAYDQAWVTAECLVDQARGALADVDCVVGPTVGIVAPPLARASSAQTTATLVANTRLANLAGLPAASIPIGSAPLPVGLQVLARDDLATLGAAKAIEACLAEQQPHFN